MAEVMTKEERDQLMAAREALWKDYVAASRAGTLSITDRRAMRTEQDRLLAAYYDGLPRVAMSRCPFCAEVFRHSIDPWGVDGYWWQEEQAMNTVEPETCPHFGLLQGALDLSGQKPRGGHRSEASVGPGVPFVIPRVLEQPGVVAVLSSLPLKNGYVAYPIAYFAASPLPPGSFTQPWTRKSYSWAKPGGGFAWRVDTDPWDFDLKPWIARDKVLWIERGDPELRPRSRRDGRCPYVELDGVREPQYILEHAIRTTAPPEGELVDPFSP